MSNPAGQAMTVSVKQVIGLGNVLVAASGKLLYSPDEEAAGMIRCAGACTSFWTPLAPGTGVAKTMSDVGHLGVINRPDGTKQVTDNGKPLYTFVLDSPGSAKGNNFSDSFGGQHFTWHALHAGGTTPSPAPTTPNGGGSGGPSTTSPGYSY
jgi:predicted lipoprotein with Yx(FWY)xxD motif